MTEAELHVDARRFDEALAALDALQEGGGRHIAALRLALRVHRGLGRWDDVLKVARQLEKHRALTPMPRRRSSSAPTWRTCAAAKATRAQLVAYWEAVPSEERRVSRLAAAAVRGR
jgi:HemY protein